MADRYHTLTPTITGPGAGEAIEFIKRVFDAEEVERYDDGGKVAHCELRIGDSIVMLGEMGDEPRMPAALFVQVDDVDARYRRALEAGATSLAEPEDQFYGSRVARVRDPFGNRWVMAMEIEKVSDEEARRRFEEMK